MGFPARSRAVASAPSSVKALRFAPTADAAPSAIPRGQVRPAREPWHRSALTDASAAAVFQL
jgi:hypothetical protein